jgi:hypothetical protein
MKSQCEQSYIRGADTPDNFTPTLKGLKDDASPDVVANQASALERQLEEFRQHRENWELERQQNVERLRREGDLLAEAWQRLESEERKLLAERELLRRTATNNMQPTLPGNTATLPSPRTAMPATATTTSEQDQNHISWVQFQQLRREIQNFGSRST